MDPRLHAALAWTALALLAGFAVLVVKRRLRREQRQSSHIPPGPFCDDATVGVGAKWRQPT